MPKEKTTNIFNKNHIEIVKIENPQTIHKYPYYDTFNTSSPTLPYWKQSDIKKKGRWGEPYIEEKKESPLGFYYYTRTYINRTSSAIRQNYRERKVISFWYDDKTAYQLKYVTRFDDNVISNTEDGMRPWDIYPGDGDFSDNMLDALVKDITRFFQMMEEKKISKVYKVQTYWENGKYTTHDNAKDLTTLKKETFSDLFGNPNGPRFQTNEEKILAHGFDLKYSFRKDKETK